MTDYRVLEIGDIPSSDSMVDELVHQGYLPAADTLLRSTVPHVQSVIRYTKIVINVDC